MAKTYINTVKYVIKIRFEIDGIVDKPDIVGAIFGQSEGLLGDEMDLKELQKNGKLGRIEITHSTGMGRTKGEIIVPSSMDMAETSILAAGIESVDKVGPCGAKLEILDIEDTRTGKRQEIKSRAQELLKRMMEKSSPETQALSEELRESARASDIVDYGADKLPAGTEIETNNEIIIVEGRADVLNLLRNQIKNVIGMNGSNITKTLIDLSRKKEATLFVDGDRGGILNARKLMQLADIDYIAKAPDGKEVEELTRKEILQSLKRRVTPEEEFKEKQERYSGKNERNGKFERSPYERPRMGPRDNGRERRYPRRRNDERRDNRGKPWERRPREDFKRRERPIDEPRKEIPILTKEEEETYKPILEKLKKSMKAQILDEKNKVIKETEVKEVVKETEKAKKPHAIVLDGVVTKRLVDAAEKAGAKYVIGIRKGKISSKGEIKAATI